MITCKCGCGKQPRKGKGYAYGCIKKLIENLEAILCKCGCGNKIESFDKYGREKEYISGHNNRKYDHDDKYAHKKQWMKNNRDWVNKNKQKRSRNRKKILMETKGNCCNICGIKYNGKNASIFDFHHREPESKSINVSGNYNNKSMFVLEEEVKKCDMLCSNCHRIHHSGEW